MILLDTNVVSEPMREAPDAGVVRWIDAQAIETLGLTPGREVVALVKATAAARYA